MVWKLWERIVIVFGLSIPIVIGFVVFLVIFGGISSYKEDAYCESIYPSRINKEYITFDKVWGTVSNVENEYIKCCRRYYELHELKTECQVFPYT